jgi:Raf kinase inhibitor-like YbhB/YbcL family protein
MAQKFNVADLRVTSPDFEPLRRIPAVQTDDGENRPPVLEWTGVPEGTRSFALVIHDPDAPLVDGFTHWVVYGIPGDVRRFDGGAGDASTPGRNSTGSTGYIGPAPPPGHGPHHYFVWLYALDTDEALPQGLDRRQLFERVEDHVIEQARVVGVYER